MCLRVEFGLCSSFIENFMEILCYRYAQIFTFWWKLFSPLPFLCGFFFFLLYAKNMRMGVKDIMHNALPVKK